MLWRVSVLRFLLLPGVIRLHGYATFNHSSGGGHLDLLRFGTLRNDASMSICVQVFMGTYVFIFLG